MWRNSTRVLLSDAASRVLPSNGADARLLFVCNHPAIPAPSTTPPLCVTYQWVVLLQACYDLGCTLSQVQLGCCRVLPPLSPTRGCAPESTPPPTHHHPPPPSLHCNIALQAWYHWLHRTRLLLGCIKLALFFFTFVISNAFFMAVYFGTESCFFSRTGVCAPEQGCEVADLHPRAVFLVGLSFFSCNILKGYNFSSVVLLCHQPFCPPLSILWHSAWAKSHS
jgi:hypothetical protein